jgi:hypothetical protein
METVERFTCSNCGASIFVKWDVDEPARIVACQRCYGENYVDTFAPLLRGGLAEQKLRTGTAVPLTYRVSHVLVTVGFKGRLNAGAGVQIIQRES